MGWLDNWTKKDIPTLEGKTAVVTGANGGIGFETALGLAEAGAKVILAVRNAEKGQLALERIKSVYPNANVSVGILDLASLASVKIFAEHFNSTGESLDILVNNAGVLFPPERQVTRDGFEVQFGTNHLAHFALTAQLMPSLKRSTSSPRVVNVSSLAAHLGRINFEDLQFEKKKIGWTTYGQSKLANLHFTFEFQRRSEEGKWEVNAYAAHPGVCYTDLVSNGPGSKSFLGVMNAYLGRVFLPSAAKGALPILYAATSPKAKPGGFYGPQLFFEMRDRVAPARVPYKAKKLHKAEKLWDVSRQLSGVSFGEEESLQA
jgi:NAD(P)-dependent dehydrogenase (short-subunit alcohol dehydrogenase family)